LRDGLISSPGRPTPSSTITAALGPARARGKKSNRAAECSQKWMGASRLGGVGPTVVHRDGSSLDCTLIGPVAGGPHGLEEEHVRGGSTLGRELAAESEQGPRDRCMLSPTGSSPG
jgi:hypothetical protein